MPKKDFLIPIIRSEDIFAIVWIMDGFPYLDTVDPTILRQLKKCFREIQF